MVSRGQTYLHKVGGGGAWANENAIGDVLVYYLSAVYLTEVFIVEVTFYFSAVLLLRSRFYI